MNKFIPAAAALSVLASTAIADATPGATLVNPGFAGNTQYDGWVGLTSGNYTGYGSFPGMSAWPAPIGSNRTSANTFNAAEPGDAGLIKVANGPSGGALLTGSALYFGGFSTNINNFDGTVGVVDSTPVANLKTVAYQVQIAEAWTYDFYNRVLPVLNYNGGAQALVAPTALIIDRTYNGTVQMPGGPQDIFINTYFLQWDLSSIAGPITDISVTFSGVQHAQVYSMRLDQSDIYTPVPTPGALGLFGIGGLTLARRRR